MRPPDQPSWPACVREIAELERSHAPGESFNYGGWHLVLASAAALRAAGRPLTTDAWIRTVREEVFEPSGVKMEPNYAGYRWDFPPFFPWYGSWFEEDDAAFPDVGAGMVISGRQSFCGADIP